MSGNKLIAVVKTHKLKRCHMGFENVCLVTDTNEVIQLPPEMILEILQRRLTFVEIQEKNYQKHVVGWSI